MRKIMIYSNYDFDDYREGAIENLLINEVYEKEEDIPENAINEEIYECMEMYWEDEKHNMREFFSGKKLLVCGTVGRWNGNFAAGKVINYDELWKTLDDCGYWEVYDKGGHFYIKGSHHDGNVSWEVKILTEKGVEMYDKWNYDYIWRDLSEREAHKKLWNNSKYTHIPHFARDFYGCKSR